MSSGVRNLMRKKLRNEKKAADKAKAKEQAEVQAFEVEGEVPAEVPTVGSIVQINWGDPSLVGADLICMPMIVTLIDQKNGRINGQMVTDPTMTGMGQGGKVIPLPPLIPIGNVPYSKERRAMTWCWLGEVSQEDPEETPNTPDEVSTQEDNTDNVVSLVSEEETVVEDSSET